MILDHVDLRVRDRRAATAFYDAVLEQIGAEKTEGDEFTTWRMPMPGVRSREIATNFGIVEDPHLSPGSTRIAFKARSREDVDALAKLLPEIGARNIEMDDGVYGEGFYGVFFEDPDGNRLEFCVNDDV